MSLNFPISLVGKRISNWLGLGSASRSFDGVDDYIDFGDSDDFSFGDGNNDSPFSVSAWIKPKRTDKFRVLAKYDSAAGVREWIFTTDGNSQLILYIFDESTNGTLLQRCSLDPITNYLDQWVHVSCTYDGSSNSSGVKLYINGVESQDTDNSAGTYVAMENTTKPLIMGSLTGTDYSEGNISDARLYNTDLTATEISDLYAGTDVQTNLVGHWLTNADNVLDNAGTNDGDNAFESEYSLDGPIPANPVFAAASRNFNGVNDVVSLNQSTPDNAIFTASVWVKLNAHDATYGEGVFGKWQLKENGSWLIYLDAAANPNIKFIVRNGANTAYTVADSGISSSSIIGEWTHIAGVADGTNLTIYINGVSEGSIAYDGTINNPTTAIVIGAYNNTLNSRHLTEGNIADCRIYDTDLTASQISDLYNGTNVTTNLVGHWLRNTDDLLDYSVNNNHGSHNGSTYSTDGPKP